MAIDALGPLHARLEVPERNPPPRPAVAVGRVAQEGGARGSGRHGAYTRSKVIESLVEQIEARYAQAQQDMADPEVIGDRERMIEAGRAFRELEPAARLAEEWRRAADDAAGAQELIAEGADDAEVRELLDDARRRMDELEEDIRLAMVERDPNDDKNVIVEIRAGAGGDEASIWAGDLYRMFTRYAEGRGFKTETMSA